MVQNLGQSTMTVHTVYVYSITWTCQSYHTIPEHVYVTHALITFHLSTTTVIVWESVCS